jgi:FkbM family methyltransferase
MTGPSGNDYTVALGLPARLLRAYLRSRLRGSTRITLLLAHRLESLQIVPITFRDRAPVFVDLRLEGSHEWLEGMPWESSPIETDEQAIMSRVARIGDVVFDIGCNVGLHTVFLSRLVGPKGRVYAFEPNPQLTHCLRRTVAGLGNGYFYPVALSDSDSEAVLYVPIDHSMASLADWTTRLVPEKTAQIICTQVRMDELIGRDGIPQPDFIKCDVEGAELKVFQGGHETLNRTDGPVILFEANHHNARGFNLGVSEAKDYLASLPLPRYEFFEIRQGGRLGPVELSDRAAVNILAVPKSKMRRLVDDPEL